MRHSVAFECANDPNIYLHMEPVENQPEVRKQWIYGMNLDFHLKGGKWYKKRTGTMRAVFTGN